MLVRLLSRRWLHATLLVLAASAVLVRLGIWQLDRLEQRRAFNARVGEQQDEPQLVLDQSTIDLDLYSMEYRSVIVTGEYLSEDEIVLRNQVWETEFGSELGVKLLTPLRISGTDTAILVDRGWIPQADAAPPAARAKYHDDGTVTVQGQLRRAETDFSFFRRPDPTLSPDQTRLDVWNDLDLERVGLQMDTSLLPVYLQRYPEGESSPPYAALPELDLSEGSHLGYAMQWFSFAALLLIGYPFYVRRQEAELKP